ncbi:hypothetical protein NEIPOLOT_00596 [Neisseria polysaccharea ATCC 43768]|nr:hypothetical protein NEIPOLOT_00596 [Neisseria polysaccharea ATCC 43768]
MVQPEAQTGFRTGEPAEETYCQNQDRQQCRRQLQQRAAFFAGGAGRCSDGILRVPFSVGSVSVGAVSVIMSVSKWFAAMPSEAAVSV